MAARDNHAPSPSGGALPATPSLSYPPSRRSSGLTTRAHESDEEEEEAEEAGGYSSNSHRQRGRGMPSPRRLLESEEEEKEEEEKDEKKEEEEKEEETHEAEDEEVATVAQEEGQEESEEEDSDMDEHNGDRDDDSCATVPDEAWMDIGMRGVEEAETIADLHRQGFPIYFTSGIFKGVGLCTLKRFPKGREYISDYLATTPGWFQRCDVPQEMALLESLSRLRMLRRVTDLHGNVVPTTRMIRDWKREEGRKNKAERKARAADRQRRRREWAAALASAARKGDGRVLPGEGGEGGGGGGRGARLSSPVPVKRSALR